MIHSKANISEFDTVIVGSGLGGLAAAALLAARGHEVAVLEAHTMLGGCAGYFDRFEKDAAGNRLRYRFDVGATTLSGALPGRPLDRLFRQLGCAPSMRRVDPGMICHLPEDVKVVRWNDYGRWIAGCCLHFGNQGQDEFWSLVHATGTRAWRLSEQNRTFPPKSASDLLGLARVANLRSLDLLRYMRSSVLDILRRCKLSSNEKFRRFIDEQLMITAQNRAEETPFLVGAMGLAYPEEVWYVNGGMSGLVHSLEGVIRKHGGRVLTKRKVIGLQYESGPTPQRGQWLLRTTREIYRARRVISNLTIQDMGDLLGSSRNTYFRTEERKAGPGWGAVTLYSAVRDDFDDLGSLYHQIHCDRTPLFDSDSIFVSFSPADDRERAPEGWRTVSISAHVADSAAWKRLAVESPVAYAARKKEVERTFLAIAGRALPGFAGAARKFTLVGTPRTFEYFARRREGMVGGTPHRLSRNLLWAPKYRTPFPELYLVGDTVYPGQGIPAVTLGALNLVDEIG